MTDPQHPTGYGTPPSAPYGSVPPGGQGWVDGAASSPYLAPSGYGGYPAPQAFGDYSGSAVPERPRTPTLGWVALIAGVIALVGSVINALIAVNLLSPSTLDGSAGDAAALVALGLLNGLMVWFLFGLWAIIQGCVALAQKRGVAQGIAALVLGLIGPWVGVVLTAVLVAQAFATT